MNRDIYTIEWARSVRNRALNMDYGELQEQSYEIYLSIVLSNILLDLSDFETIAQNLISIGDSKIHQYVAWADKSPMNIMQNTMSEAVPKPIESMWVAMYSTDKTGTKCSYELRLNEIETNNFDDNYIQKIKDIIAYLKGKGL